MNQEMYLIKVKECNGKVKQELQEKMQEVFQELEKTISSPGFDALQAGAVFESGEIQKVLPYIVSLTQNISRQYTQAFLDAGMNPDTVDIHWMTIFSKLTAASPKFKEVKAPEVEERIVEHEVKKQYRDAEDNDNLGIFLPAGGALVGGTIGGLAVGGVAAVITGVVVGAALGFSTYKVTIQVLADRPEGGKKVEIVTDTYRVNGAELHNLCQEENARVRGILENWLDEIESVAKDNLPVR